MNAMTTPGVTLRRSTLAVALLGAFGYGQPVSAVNLVVSNNYDLGTSTMNNSTVRVTSGGVLTGNGAKVSGSATEVLLIESGGNAVLENVTLSNDLDHATGRNGRTARATGTDAQLTLVDSRIDIRAYSTTPDTDYNHSYTAAVAADNGGHVDVQGGSITAQGSKRTVGMQANDGGSITASDLEITTHNHFGHAVQAYRSPSGSEILTPIELNRVTITTLGANYALGAQVGNKGATLKATDTHFTTEGSSSAGVEVFNGAEATLIDGTITTHGDVAAGVRVYGGSLGAGKATVMGTRIHTKGMYSSGILAGDLVEPTSGIVDLTNVDILTEGQFASGIEAAYGSQITSAGSTIRTEGNRAHGVYVHRSELPTLPAASVELSGDTIETRGEHAYGMLASGEDAVVSATHTRVTTQGIRGYGAHALDGGNITLTGGSVTTANPKGQSTQSGDGSRAYALYARGEDSTVTAQGGTQITTFGQRAYGAYAEHGGHVVLNNASVTTHGFMGYGIYANWEGSRIDANNLDITTTGQVGDGVWAWSGVVNLNGGTVTVNGEPNSNSPYETANGLVAVGGTDIEARGVITATGTKVLTRGTNSAGIVAGGANGSQLVAGTVNLRSATVDVHGERAVTGRVSYGGELDARNSTLRSMKGNGIVMTDDATVTLVGTRLDAAQASLVSNLNTAGRVQNITVGSGSSLLVNNGTLLQVNRSSAGMDGIVNLTLAAGSNSRGDIIDLDGLSRDNTTRAGKTNFIVENGAKWAGVVHGVNDVEAKDGTTFVDEGGGPIAGNMTTGANATLLFNNGATIGGGLSTGTGTQATFNGPTVVNQNVVANGSSLIFSGPATIGGSVSTDATTLTFSTNAPTVIDGDLDLNQQSTLSGGSTTTPITIHGNANANNGSVLGGNLFVHGALGGNGGTVSPGNSIGTQSYATSADFSGSYVAEINSAGLSDLIIVRNGNFDLSGIDLTVAQEDGNGGYLLNHAYTIVRTEAGNIENEFASETLDPVSFANARVKLDPVRYGLSDVKISLSADDAAIDRSVWSANQQATYQGVLSAGTGNPLAFAVLASPDMAQSLNQISGELHASTQSALLSAGELVSRTVLNRMRGNSVGGAQLGAQSGTPLSESNASSAAGERPVWAEVVGHRNTLDANGNASKTKSQLAGVFVGGETQWGDGWRVGAALGVTDGHIKVDDLSSKSQVTNYTAALYGGRTWPTARGNLNLLGGAAYTLHDIDSRRTVSLTGPQTLKADYKANTAQLFAELSHSFPVGTASTVEPYLGLAWLTQHADSFSESGGSAALRGNSERTDITSFTLGLRGSTAVNLGNTQAVFKGGLGWRHAAGDIDPHRHMAFIQGAGSEFTISGVPLAKNAAVVDLAAEMSVGKTSSLGLAFTGQFGDGNTGNSAALYWQTRF